MIGKSISFRAVVSGCSAAVFIVKQKNSQTLVNKGFASFLTCLADTKWMHIKNDINYDHSD